MELHLLNLIYGFNCWRMDLTIPRMKITFQGELNMVMKMMLKGKLEKGINQLGEGLAKIPYSLLSNSGF